MFGFKTMSLLSLSLSLTHAIVASSSSSSSLFNMDVVMRAGDVIPGLDESEFPVYRNGRCTVRFNKDGNFATRNGFNTGGWDSNQKSFCFNPSLPGPRNVEYRLQQNGNFVSRCGYYLDYSTHTGGRAPTGDYFMAIDDDCILHIFKGTFDCNSVSIEEELWTNIKQEPLSRGDRLGQGEYVWNKQDGTRLLMQSEDGNLVLYKSGPTGPAHTVLWAANEEWEAPPTSNMNEFYARITKRGRLVLVGIDYNNGNETIYFNKKLHTKGADCFTVEYDADKDDIVAIPCVGESMSRALSGQEE